MTNKTWQKWTEQEIAQLRIHWKSSTMEELLAQFPGRGYNSLMLKATELGIKSEIKRKRKGSLDFLDTLTQESCYWWGFIMADGHLSPRGELVITLSVKDREHLEKLGKKLGISVRDRTDKNSYTGAASTYSTLRIQDKQFGLKWLTSLSITSAKTYNPPDLKIFCTPENLLPFFIGFVDGDGCIWKSRSWLNLRVELHASWFELLQLLSQKLQEFYGISTKVGMSKRGTAKLWIATKKDFLSLKPITKELPCLQRKWSLLDQLP